MTKASTRPDRQALEAARQRRLPDLIAPGLDILFCGINPGLYSAATGHHFARPGNRFWPALHRAGLTPRRLRPDEEHLLLPLGMGLTNLVPRATASADELTREEIIAGGRALKRKLQRYAPRRLAVLGIGAYRLAFGDKHAQPGKQNLRIGDTTIWVLPSPSGLNAHYNLDAMATAFRELKHGAR